MRRQQKTPPESGRLYTLNAVCSSGWVGETSEVLCRDILTKDRLGENIIDYDEFTDVHHRNANRYYFKGANLIRFIKKHKIEPYYSLMKDNAPE